MYENRPLTPELENHQPAQASAANLSLQINPEITGSRPLDNNVRIFTKPGSDAGNEDYFLLAFDPSAHPQLKTREFSDEIERDLGFYCTPGEPVPLMWEKDGEILSSHHSTYWEDTSDPEGNGVTEIGGHFGIKMHKKGVEAIKPDAAAGIAVLIARQYMGDETPRVLRNHASDELAESIEITGEGYNLAKVTTQEHPTVDLDEILRTHHTIRQVEVAPHLARVAFV